MPFEEGWLSPLAPSSKAGLREFRAVGVQGHTDALKVTEVRNETRGGQEGNRAGLRMLEADLDIRYRNV